MQNKAKKGDTKANVKANVKFVAVILAAATVLVSARLADLQIINSDKYKRSATYSQWNEEALPATRGTIYDANGNVVAQSAQTWKLYLIPENFNDEDFRRKVCRDLANELSLDYDELLEESAVEASDDDSDVVIAHKKEVKTQIEYDEKCLIDCGKSSDECTTGCLMHRTFEKTTTSGDSTYTEKFSYSDVLGLETDTKRYYPMGDFASSVVGFVNSDGNGVSGIERYYNSDLSGSDGKKTSYGSNVSDENETTYEAKDGTSLVLTIDETIQYCLDEQLNSVYESSGAIGAYGIVMDPNTGAILGMDSVGYKGGYDLNNPDELNSYYQGKLETAVSSDDFSYLDKYLADVEDGESQLNEIKNEDSFDLRKEMHTKKLSYYFKMEQWNNYLVSEEYYPGSVFKIFLTSAAIEENVLGDDFTYTCTGSTVVDDRTFNCHQSSGHGTQTLREGLMHSCNPFFIKVGLTLGAEKFYEYFKAFGFTEKTGVESLEEASYYNYYTDENLTRVTLASESFGQSFTVTPMQVITAMSAIANGGYLMQPYLVSKELDSNGNVISTTEPVVRRQVISEETAAEVASMMEDVVKSGTGKNGYVAGYRVAGKTGTSQKHQVKGVYIASFGCFAPADDPQIAVLIVVDEPKTDMNGSTIAAPVAAKVVETSLEYLGVERQYTDEEMDNLDTTTPGVIGQSVDSAQSTLEADGFLVRVVGDGDTVISQSPAGGQTIPQGGIVAIYTTDNDEDKITVTVPDLTGMSVNEVESYAESEGINIRVSGTSGSGVVSYDQSVSPGSEVEYGTIVTVFFKSYQDVGDT